MAMNFEQVYILEMKVPVWNLVYREGGNQSGNFGVLQTVFELFRPMAIILTIVKH